jgi:nucleoside-diphosphate-sugar epimerase
VTRSIVHLLEEVDADNTRATERLGYRPQYSWWDALRTQMAEMEPGQRRPMKMYRPIA